MRPARHKGEGYKGGAQDMHWPTPTAGHWLAREAATTGGRGHSMQVVSRLGSCSCLVLVPGSMHSTQNHYGWMTERDKVDA